MEGGIWVVLGWHCHPAPAKDAEEDWHSHLNSHLPSSQVTVSCCRLPQSLGLVGPVATAPTQFHGTVSLLTLWPVINSSFMYSLKILLLPFPHFILLAYQTSLRRTVYPLVFVE